MKKILGKIKCILGYHALRSAYTKDTLICVRCNKRIKEAKKER